MRIDEIHVGRTYQGKGGDADKTRKVLSISPTGLLAVTQVYRNGEDMGESRINLAILAQWAGEDVTESVTETEGVSHA